MFCLLWILIQKKNYSSCSNRGLDEILDDPANILGVLNTLFGDVTYQPIQNAKLTYKNYDNSKQVGDLQGVNYNSYLTFTEENADLIAGNLDGLIADILDKAGLDSLEYLVGGFITPDLVTNLVSTIIGLLADKSVTDILNVVAGLDFEVRTDKNQPGQKLKLDLTVQGFAQALSELDLNGKHKYMKSFYSAITASGVNTWADVKLDGVSWGFTNSSNTADKFNGFVKALAGVLTPLNDILGLLLNGEGKYLNVMGVINIAGGNGYDYGIIPLLEALGFKSSETKTALQYAEAIANDETQTLGYILEMVVKLVLKLLDKPVDTLLTILPNLGYYFLNDGLLLTVRNIVAPIYDVLDLALPLLGIDYKSYLKLEELLHSIDVGQIVSELINPGGKVYDFHIPVIDWRDLVERGGSSTKEVATSRSHPGNKAVGTWANSFKTRMSADEYARYIQDKNLKDASLYKNTQTYIVADKGDTLVLVLTWLFDMFSETSNREALVKWLVEFFELKSGAEQTVRYAVNELFNMAETYNSSDILVSALLYGLGMAVTLDAALMGKIAPIQELYKKLFDALGSNGECTYAGIARVMEELTKVWEETIGPEEDYNDAVVEGEQTLNWFQRIIKKIKDFFARIFGIFK